jgi:ribonuclease HI
MKQLSLEFISKFPTSRTKIYTDASIANKICGLGIFCPETEFRESIKLKNLVSICTAEMIAIKRALRYAKENGINKPVILTDSLSSCRAILGQRQENFITETIHEILKLSMEIDATIVWIPSHVGIWGNETADELAKKALNENVAINNKIRHQDATKQIDNKLLTAHQEFYDAADAGQKFKMIYPEITKKPWYHQNGLTAEEVKIINRLISNFSYDKRWLFRFKKSESEECEKCKKIETAEHLVFECEKYLETRKNYKNLNKLKNIKELWSAKNRETLIKEILQFIKENKIEF